MRESNETSVRHVVGSSLSAIPGAVELLENSPTGLIYATPRFMSILSESLEAEAHWLIVERGGSPTALLPFLEKDGAQGSVINSLPFFGSNGGPIATQSESESVDKVMQAFVDYALTRSRLLSSTFVENPLAPLVRSADGSTPLGHPTDTRISQITDLDSVGTVDALMQRFDDPRPRNIRKAIKVGISVVEDPSDAAFQFLIDTHVSNMTAIGGLPKQAQFFGRLRAVLRPNEWRLHIGRLGREPVAALLTLRHNRTVEYFTPVIREEFRSTQALSYIIFEAMWQAAQEGYSRWNWGGTWLSQTGVYEFKRKWGAQECRYVYFTHIHDEAVLEFTPELCQAEYPYFYLYPFDMTRGMRD